MATKAKTLKIGTKVSFVTKNGLTLAGKLVGFEQKPNGKWASVNVAEPRQTPVLRFVRESQLTVA